MLRSSILILLMGCTYGGEMVKVAEPQTVAVTWERRAPDSCGMPPLVTVLACTFPSRDWSMCRIVAPEGTSDAVLGHEMRHCFGWVHE